MYPEWMGVIDGYIVRVGRLVIVFVVALVVRVWRGSRRRRGRRVRRCRRRGWFRMASFASWPPSAVRGRLRLVISCSVVA